jgi:hypothetical protein
MIVTYDIPQGRDYAPLPKEPSQCWQWDETEDFDIDDADEQPTQRGETGWQKISNTLQDTQESRKMRSKVWKTLKGHAHIPTV